MQCTIFLSLKTLQDHGTTTTVPPRLLATGVSMCAQVLTALHTAVQKHGILMPGSLLYLFTTLSSQKSLLSTS